MMKLRALLAGEIEPGLYRFASRIAPSQVCDVVERAGWRCACIDARGIASKPAFLDAFAGALHFPDYFGRNWDAFEECLRDLSWGNFNGAKGVIIILDRPDGFARAEPEEWAVARDVLAGAVTTHAQTGRPLVVLLRGSRTAAAGLESL